MPQTWYAIVRADEASLRSYLDHFRAMKDPTLEAMPSEGPDFAKLSSTLFTGAANDAEVQREALRLVEIITGAAKIKQDPGNLRLQFVVAVYADGETKEFRRATTGSFFSKRPMISWQKEGQVHETFEKSVVLFALKWNNIYPQVNEVLRSLAQSDDWSGLYRILEAIRLDLNKNDERGKKDARQKIVERGWVSESELNSFDMTVDTYRHHRVQPNPRTMTLVEAQNFIGRIIEAWIRELAKRPAPPTSP
jgi:hypothetical protein